jgi:deoxyribose-phosphate aldolase
MTDAVAALCDATVICDAVAMLGHVLQVLCDAVQVDVHRALQLTASTITGKAIVTQGLLTHVSWEVLVDVAMHLWCHAV